MNDCTEDKPLFILTLSKIKIFIRKGSVGRINLTYLVNGQGKEEIRYYHHSNVEELKSCVLDLTPIPAGASIVLYKEDRFSIKDTSLEPGFYVTVCNNMWKEFVIKAHVFRIPHLEKEVRGKNL